MKTLSHPMILLAAAVFLLCCVSSHAADPPVKGFSLPQEVQPREGVGIAVLGYDFLLNHYRSPRDREPGDNIYIRDKKFSKAIYAHAPSELHIRLPKPATEFTATMGLHRDCEEKGLAQFMVFVNGELRFLSKPITRQTTGQAISVPLDNAKEFVLAVSDLGSDKSDHALWGTPRVQYADGTAQTVSDMLYFIQSPAENIQAPGPLPKEYIATCSRLDTTIKIWDKQTGRQLRTLTAHGHTPMHLSLSPDGKFLATAGVDASLHVWDVEAGKEICNPLLDYNGFRGPAWTTDGKNVLAVFCKDVLLIWDFQNDTLRKYPIAVEWGFRISISPDNKYLAFAGSGAYSALLDFKTGEILAKLPQENSSAAVQFSPDGNTLATAGHARKLYLWEVPTGKPLKTLSGHKEAIEILQFSPDGKTVACGCWDSAIYLWDLSSYSVIHMMRGPGGNVRGLRFTADGTQIIAAGYNDNAIRVWDVESGECVQLIHGHTALIENLDLYPK